MLTWFDPDSAVRSVAREAIEGIREDDREFLVLAQKPYENPTAMTGKRSNSLRSSCIAAISASMSA